MYITQTLECYLQSSIFIWEKNIWFVFGNPFKALTHTHTICIIIEHSFWFQCGCMWLAFLKYSFLFYSDCQVNALTHTPRAYKQSILISFKHLFLNRSVYEPQKCSLFEWNFPVTSTRTGNICCLILSVSFIHSLPGHSFLSVTMGKNIYIYTFFYYLACECCLDVLFSLICIFNIFFSYIFYSIYMFGLYFISIDVVAFI